MLKCSLLGGPAYCHERRHTTNFDLLLALGLLPEMVQISREREASPLSISSACFSRNFDSPVMAVTAEGAAQAPTRVLLPVLPMSCASRSHDRTSRDTGNLSHLFPATSDLPARSSPPQPTLPRQELSPSATPQLHRAPAGETARACFHLSAVPPLPCARCVGFLRCQLSARRGRGGGAARRAPVSLPPHCHLPLSSWRPGEGEGRASGMFGLLFLWALYNFKGFPLVHRGQGAEVRRHGLTSLSPPPRKGETRTHTQRKKKRKRGSWQTLLSPNLSSP